MKDKVIIEIPFNGSAVTYIDQNGRVAHSDAGSFEEYKKMHPSRKLAKISFVEYSILHSNYHQKSLVKTTETRFRTALKNPPVRRLNVKPFYQVFYTKNISGIFYIVYVYNKRSKCYYKGCKSIILTPEELFQEMTKEIGIGV